MLADISHEMLVDISHKMLVDISDEMSALFYLKKKQKRMLYAAILLGALRIKHCNWTLQHYALKQVVKYSLWQDFIWRVGILKWDTVTMTDGNSVSIISLDR